MLLSIDEACFPPEIAYDAMDLRHMMSRAGAETLVLEEDGRIVAFLLMEVDRNRKTATLVTLDVLKDHRRSGYASSLLARSEQMLAGLGVTSYKLQVDTQNEGAISFYRKNGFRDLAAEEWTADMALIREIETKQGLLPDARVFMRRSL